MLIYILERCSTCKKAIAFLDRHHIPYQKMEIVSSPPTKKQLFEMLVHLKGDFRKLFNISGNMYRELSLKEKVPHMSQEAAIELLSKHGMLIKRPFLLSDKVGLLGFSEKAWASHLVYSGQMSSSLFL